MKTPGRGSPGPDIRGLAARGEARELLHLLRGSTRDTMCDILDALVDMGEPAVPDLIPALRDPDDQVHLIASIALEKIGKTAVIPLIRAFKEKNGLFRVKIADILVNIGDAAVGEVITALRDPDEEVRVLSALALGEIRDRRALEPLISALSDGSEKVRAQAAISLGELGLPGAEEALAGLAERDDSPSVRQMAGNALVRLRGIEEDRELLP